jgi:hypothetical protein
MSRSERKFKFTFLPSSLPHPPTTTTGHLPRGIRHSPFAKFQGMYREVVSLLSSTCGAPCNVREWTTTYMLPNFYRPLILLQVAQFAGWSNERQSQSSSRYLPLLQYAACRVCGIRQLSVSSFKYGSSLRRSRPTSPQADPIRLEHLSSRRHILVLRRCQISFLWHAR